MTGLMIQGTGSNVGKSLLVAGLCRAYANRGLQVRPFKPQNMSNNAAVTADGGEIGRAQALQAMACRVDSHVDMNPVLLKPQSDTGSQIVLQGKVINTANARDYFRIKPTLLPAVLDSYQRLAADSDLVIVEGAGSPAEINLRKNDIANMGFADAADIPVILAGDIDRGGVIAQIVGTKTVLPADDAARIKGFMINKFRGDPSLFDEGYAQTAALSQWPGFGVLPWFPDAHIFPAEDALDIKDRKEGGDFHIACLALSRIANFDDLDPLAQEPGVSLTMVKPGMAIPGNCDLVIIPGSKSTIADLAFLRDQGWHIDLAAHHRRGGHILGICGGYQMLGKQIHDPDGIEGRAGHVGGLGLLDIETVMQAEKTVTRQQAMHVASNENVTAYEIHIGDSKGPDSARPFARIDNRDEGAISADGRVTGTYLHGLFAEDSFRQAWLAHLGAASSQLSYGDQVDDALDRLAAHMEQHLDLDGLLALAR